MRGVTEHRAQRNEFFFTRSYYVSPTCSLGRRLSLVSPMSSHIIATHATHANIVNLPRN